MVSVFLGLCLCVVLLVYILREWFLCCKGDVEDWGEVLGIFLVFCKCNRMVV